MRRPEVQLAWRPGRGWGLVPQGQGGPLGVRPEERLAQAAERLPAAAAPKLLEDRRPWPLWAALDRWAVVAVRRGCPPLLGDPASVGVGYPGGIQSPGDRQPGGAWREGTVAAAVGNPVAEACEVDKAGLARPGLAGNA